MRLAQRVPLNRLKPPLRGGWNERKVAQRVRLAYGRGSLETYIPWIGVRDLSSIGTSTRMWSPKTRRKMEFLSNIERDTFLIFEFKEDFIDWLEQWPVDRRNSKWAAEKLRYRHPIYIGSTEPVVMTVDAISVRDIDGKVVRVGIDCKHSSATGDRRTLQKLAITQLALSGQNVPHLVVTELSINKQEVKNILWVRLALRKRNEIEAVPGLFDLWPAKLHQDLLAHLEEEPNSSVKVNQYCKAFEVANRLGIGNGLRCIKLLMWQHLVEFDMKGTRMPNLLPLSALRVRSSLGNGGGAIGAKSPGAPSSAETSKQRSELEGAAA